MRIAPLPATLLLLLIASPLLALRPDQIALVVNVNEPEGVELARFYAGARDIPDGRTIELNLPPGEQISFARYERDVVPAVRQFLRDNALEEKVTCLVTFYGLPLRIGARVLSDQEQQELAELRGQLERMPEALLEITAAAEAVARRLDPAFRPGQEEEIAQLAQRIERALRVAGQQLAGLEPAERAEAVQELAGIIEQSGGPAALFERIGQPELQNPQVPEERRRRWAALGERLRQFQSELRQLQEKRHEPEARAGVRDLVRTHLGPFVYAQVLQSQIEYFNTERTVAAFDSELALLWWINYSRAGWQANTLHYRAEVSPQTPPTLMVMRLDAHEPQVVRQLILASLTAERDGLRGRAVIDTRGIALMDSGRVDPFGQYDQMLRNLRQMIDDRMAVTLDQQPEVLGPGSADDVALYCGWYSVRNYVPCCTFNPGAVGFHIASFELISLRRPEERGWVRGLLGDGVAATLGPVAEPFLQAFPRPDEFFPLLLTGQLTLAEVYWKTTPMTSWMMSMIGDPLYRPYQANPVLQPGDLPEVLRRALP